MDGRTLLQRCEDASKKRVSLDSVRAFVRPSLVRQSVRNAFEMLPLFGLQGATYGRVSVLVSPERSVHFSGEDDENDFMDESREKQGRIHGQQAEKKNRLRTNVQTDHPTDGWTDTPSYCRFVATKNGYHPPKNSHLTPKIAKLESKQPDAS